MKKHLFNLLLIVISLCLTLAALEIVIRLGSLAHRPTWTDKQQAFIDTIAIPYSYGLVRPHASIPDLRVFFPSGSLQPEPVSIQTNRFGMRMRGVALERAPEIIRIAIMGDSCTFGWMIPEENAYPRVLEKLLNQKGSQRYEVLNFGVPGYTSFHGQLQYERLVKAFKPDVLILAYGFNDSYDFRFSEKEFYERLRERNLIDGLHDVSLFMYDNSAFARWFINRIKSIGKNAVEEELKRRAVQSQWFPRVDRESYKFNLRKMIQDARSYGCQTIVMNLDLPNSWVRQPVRDVSQEESIGSLDIQALFESQSQPDERLIGIRSSVQPPGAVQPPSSAKTTLCFRVWVPDSIVINPSIYLLVNDSQHPWPWEIPMYDDGTHGDERPNDRVWSTSVEIDSRENFDYAFINGLLPDPNPFYENSSKALRFYYRAEVESLAEGSIWVSPTHTLDRIPYGHLMVPGDVIHPNAAGHKLIAESLLPFIP